MGSHDSTDPQWPEDDDPFLSSQGDPGLRWDYHFLGFICSASNGGWVQKPGDNYYTTYCSGYYIMVPDAGLAIFFAILPALWIRRGRVKQPRRGPHCVICGYDLRATPGRCPECGAIPATTE